METTRETDYALRAILDLVEHGTCSTAEIARRQDISPSFLTKIVYALRRAGVVRTQRGTGGGISLAVPPQILSLGQVVEAVQGPLAINRCVADPSECDKTDSCALYRVFVAIQQAVIAELDVTFDELLNACPESVAHAAVSDRTAEGS